LAKSAVLTGSVLSALVASVILARRNAIYRRIEEDDSLDGVPDAYASEPPESDR
jgi:NhaA family Na+:H+ antiporter